MHDEKNPTAETLETNDVSARLLDKLPPTAQVLAAVLLWSSGGFLIKSTTLDALSVSFGRSLFAVFVVGVFAFRGGLKPNFVTFLSAIFYAGTLTFFVYATKNTTAANAIFLQYTAPVYILFLAPFILKENFRAADLVTVAICLAGMSLFFIGQLDTTSIKGNAAALASGVCMGIYFTLLRHPRALGQNPAMTVFWGNLLIVLALFLFVYDNFGAWQKSDFAAIAGLGIFQIGISYLLFTRGVARGVRALDASIIGFIEPILNPLWVFLLIGEQPSRWAILGGLIIVFAVILQTVRQTAEKKAANPL